MNKDTVGWNNINWRKVEHDVFKLQKRIYAASQRGDIKKVRRLQKTLVRSWSGRVLAIRKVTQDNQGRKTAGVDGVKSLTPTERINMIPDLKPQGKSQPTRRVWIPKPGTNEKRPLGIPTVCPYCTSNQDSLGIFCLTRLFPDGRAFYLKLEEQL